MPRDPSLDYDAVCNACGRAIHPPRPPASDDWEEWQQWVAEVSTQPTDCVWLERHRLRSPQLAHPMTNYVCTGCNEKLSHWLTGAWRSPEERGATP